MKVGPAARRARGTVGGMAGAIMALLRDGVKSRNFGALSCDTSILEVIACSPFCILPLLNVVCSGGWQDASFFVHAPSRRGTVCLITVWNECGDRVEREKSKSNPNKYWQDKPIKKTRYVSSSVRIMKGKGRNKTWTMNDQPENEK